MVTSLIGDQWIQLQRRHEHHGITLAVHNTKGSNIWKCEVIIVEVHREINTKGTWMCTAVKVSIQIASEKNLS